MADTFALDPIPVRPAIRSKRFADFRHQTHEEAQESAFST
jgi:hypothetical protein